MTIHKASAREYSSVTAAATTNYIEDFSVCIMAMIQDNREKLPECNKTQLNAIAAELETVHKRLRWILEGKY